MFHKSRRRCSSMNKNQRLIEEVFTLCMCLAPVLSVYLEHSQVYPPSPKKKGQKDNSISWVHAFYAGTLPGVTPTPTPSNTETGVTHSDHHQGCSPSKQRGSEWYNSSWSQLPMIPEHRSMSIPWALPGVTPKKGKKNETEEKKNKGAF